MKNIWKLNREASAEVKRNNFDLSFQNHATFKFGYLYPVFKRKVYPGDSFRISSAFDLKMMPVEFPVQSRMRAHMHYFYVKNKNLWDNWEDWIDGLRSNDECPHPYIQRPDTDFKTGGIHDFMNQATTVVTSSIDFVAGSLVGTDNDNGSRLPTGSNVAFYRDIFIDSQYTIAGDFKYGSEPFVTSGRRCLKVDCNLGSQFLGKITFNPHSFNYITTHLLGSSGQCYLVAVFNTPLSDSGYISSSALTFTDNVLNVEQGFVDAFNNYRALFPDYSIFICNGSGDGVVSAQFEVSSLENSVQFQIDVPASTFSQFSDFAEQNDTHFYDNEELLDALPYRAYEAIYRSYFTNDILQPLVINGRKEYNKFCTNTGDGADTTDYHLFRRNYEYDFLTSAFPSPQAGTAPLVGINQLGEVTIEDENGITTGKAVLNDEGKVTDIVITSPLASIEHGRTAVNIAQLGMSINDFRNANALQRLAERFLRGGYRYKPWKKAVWGVTSSDDSLDMPIFLGGYSRDINISPIYSQANTLTTSGGQEFGSNLGDWAGVGRVVGGSNHDVQHYFDDYGWVIGVLSITPVPAYSQLIPKENLCPKNYLDYYFPDMAKLGMQPITYREVTPLQSYIDSFTDQSKKLTDTFGYQRPNYDLVGSVDEVHGEFRSSLSQQLVNRIFAHRPELGTEFLEVNPAEINDIFINQDPSADVFIGHLAFRIYSKRPLPRVWVAGLGF